MHASTSGRDINQFRRAASVICIILGLYHDFTIVDSLMSYDVLFHVEKLCINGE